MATTKVAVVGAGFIADYHLQILTKLPGVEVVALVDLDRARAEALARKHGVTRVHGSIAELVAAGKPDIAHALVPPQRHVEVATELLEAGVGVFLEKPIATSRADALRLLQLAESLKLPLAVNHNATFHPAFTEAKRRLGEQQLGPLDHVFACLSVPLRQLTTRDFSHYMFRAPRNIVFEQATHPFSQLVDLLGPVRSVTAAPGGRRELAPGVVFYDTWQLSLTHERGTASLFLSFGRDFAESFLRLLGPDGSLHVDLLRGHVTQLQKTPWPDFWDQLKNAQWNARSLLRQGWSNALDYVLSTLKLKGRSDPFYVGMRDAIAAFHASLRGGARYPCNARQGLDVVEACELAAAAVPESESTVAAVTPSIVPAANYATPAPGAPRDAILVTGANGFIGSHVVARLLRDGKRVHALVRKPAFVPDALRDPGVTLFAGDVTDAAALERAAARCHAAIHLATGGGDTWEQFARTMVGGARTVAAACKRAGVTRLVYTSSIAAYDLSDSNAAPVTEATPLDPTPDTRSLYARGKIAAEAALLQAATELGLDLVIARPGFVVGASGAPQHSGVGFWAKDSQVFGWGGGRLPLPFVLVDDVAEALIKMATLPAAAGRSYNLVGDVLLTARDWVAQLRERLGRDFVFHPQAIWSWFAEEYFKYAVKKAIRKPGAQPPSWTDLATRAAARRFDNSRPKQELGWQPVADRAQFMARALPPPRAARAP
ncbi:MAG: NAD-dependent epimerase/dehydratase family protein [Myxococcales bacterium]|nr:NAD-dependent epimerase/dehydratase family protein [Myxococcales bacterium]